MFLFYDIETTGLNKCFDQVLQFAAIYTDAEFNELERHEIFVKLNPDIIPSPKAIITHRIPLKCLKTRGIAEFEAITKIHALLNRPISIGYNTLGFHDEFLRFSFDRNLLAPYTHQYANGCSRGDLYPITVLYYLFKNEILNWPERADAISLKLEFLSKINNLHNGIAHDALNDVLACVALAKIFAKEQKMFDYARGYFDKKTDLERMSKLPFSFHCGGADFQEALLIDGVFGAKNFYQCPVIALGRHNHYKNQTLWLKIDSENLVNLRVDNLPESFNLIYRKKDAETGLLLSKEPRFMRYLNSERLELVEKNKLWLQKNPELLLKLSNYHREYKYPVVLNIDVDASLYQRGFRSDFEMSLCRKFHAADVVGKINIVNNVGDRHACPLLCAQMIRVLGRNYRELLPENIVSEFDSLKTAVNDLVDYKGNKRLTPQDALNEIAELGKGGNLDAKQNELLAELEQYIKNI